MTNDAASAQPITLVVRPVIKRRINNACTEPCDMDYGPCACGAWHNRVYPGQSHYEVEQ